MGVQIKNPSGARRPPIAALSRCSLSGLHYLDLTRVRAFKFISRGIFLGEVGRFPPIRNLKRGEGVNPYLWYQTIVLIGWIYT